ESLAPCEPLAPFHLGAANGLLKGTLRVGAVLVGAVLGAAPPSTLAAQSPLLPPASNQLPPQASDAWDSIVREWRQSAAEEGIVGASLGLVRHGDLISFAAHGMADVDANRRVDEETIYHWASITKTFTAISIMQLRDRGLLRLDDPIVEYVPELRGVHNPYGSMEEITIRQLMSHSAGFRGSSWPWAGSEPWHPHEPTEWSQLVAMIPYTRIHFEPGSRYSYSNPGIIFLGRVIEAVTGDVYEAYVDKNIFRPLGMERAYFDVTPWHLREHRSNHYFVRDGRPEAGGLDFNTGITVSNGGLNAPVPDMARYLAFLLGTPVGDADHDAVLPRSSLEEMWDPVVPIGESPLGQGSMGLSFFLHDKRGERVVGHTGTQKAFYSFFYIDPGTATGVIAAYNTGPGDETGPDTNALRVRTSARVIDELFPLLREGR
ncbi:MAG: serine hydrolase domain-containing protein, partial [Longimicrobiales bacterium]|nr:serine hydrolase domain-containing protein [Longimicrobiales bacterium]